MRKFFTAAILAILFYAAPISHAEIHAPDENKNPQIILYSFKTDDNVRGVCTGVSVSSQQFVTAKHCLIRVTDIANNIKILSHPFSNVSTVKYIDQGDLALVTVGPKSFQDNCLALNNKALTSGDTLTLYRSSTSGKEAISMDLKVTNPKSRVYNPDIGDSLEGIIRTQAIDGASTQDGNSGSPVFLSSERNNFTLVGVLIGVSKRDGSILIEPATKLIGNVKCENERLTNKLSYLSI